MKKILALIIILSSITSNSYSSENSLSEAEKVAHTYMTAFFKGNLKLSFSLMDQELLKQQQDQLKKAYESSIENGTSDKFVQQFHNINSFGDLLKLSPSDFFATLSEKDRERAKPEHLELMKKTAVNVIGSEFIEGNKAKVSLEIINLKPDGNTFTQKSGLILFTKNGKWVVIGNAK